MWPKMSRRRRKRRQKKIRLLRRLPVASFVVYQPVNVLVIQQNLQLLERAVSTSDPRFTYRVLKTSNLRKRLSPQVLVQAVRQFYPPDHPSVPTLQSLLDKVNIKRCGNTYADFRNIRQWK